MTQSCKNTHSEFYIIRNCNKWKKVRSWATWACYKLGHQNKKTLLPLKSCLLYCTKTKM